LKLYKNHISVYLKLFTWQFLLVLHVSFVLKAKLAIDAVTPIMAEEALASCIGALTSGIAHNSKLLSDAR
jgi:hypothetical protein